MIKMDLETRIRLSKAMMTALKGFEELAELMTEIQVVPTVEDIPAHKYKLVHTDNTRKVTINEAEPETKEEPEDDSDCVIHGRVFVCPSELEELLDILFGEEDKKSDNE